MQDIVILYYLLSHPQKVEELGFKKQYIISADRKVLQDIYKELRPVCKQYNQIIPLEESIKIFSAPCYINNAAQIVNTLQNMYILGPQALQEHSELDMDFYVKKMKKEAQKLDKLSAMDEVKQSIEQDNLNKDQLQNKFEYVINKRKDMFDDEETVSVYSDLFDDKFLDNTEEEKVKTGISHFDKYLCGGFLKQTISSVQTGTGKGKTTMLITLASNILLQGYNVAFINLEMREQELQFNIYSALQEKYSYNDIRNNYKRENSEFVRDLQTTINSQPIGRFVTIKNDSFESLTCKHIEQKLKALEESEEINFDIVFVDYIGLLQAHLIEKSIDRSDQVAQRTMREFKIMCERNNWAGVTATQSNRGALNVGTKQSEKNQSTNPMNFISNSYAQAFELDNFISIERVEDVDSIKVQFIKHRQWHEKEEPQPFFMDYNARQKRYVQTDKSYYFNSADLTYKMVVDLLHDQVKQIDIINLCKENKVGPKTVDSMIKKYYSKKYYKPVKNTTIELPQSADFLNFMEMMWNKKFNYIKKLNDNTDIFIGLDKDKENEKLFE